MRELEQETIGMVVRMREREEPARRDAALRCIIDKVAEMKHDGPGL